MRELTVHASEPNADKACRLDAGGQRRRQNEINSLFAAIAQRRELDDGQVLLLRGNPNELWPRVEAFIAEESVCCPFFSFQAAERDDGVELTITGARLDQIAMLRDG
jgi:hypothetical protein